MVDISCDGISVLAGTMEAIGGETDGGMVDVSCDSISILAGTVEVVNVVGGETDGDITCAQQKVQKVSLPLVTQTEG